MWAKSDEQKWRQLIGCIFEKKYSGTDSLAAVRLPYLEFRESGKWEVRLLSDGFANLIWDSRCPAEIKTKIEEREERDKIRKHEQAERERIAQIERNELEKERGEHERIIRKERAERELTLLRQRQKQEEVRIAVQRQKHASISKFCADYDLPFEEILKLVDCDKDHAHRFTRVLLELKQGTRSVIPKPELAWAATNGASGIVGNYVNKKLYSSISNVDFMQSRDSAIYFGQRFQVGAMHEYVKKEDRSDSDVHSGQILKFKNGERHWVGYYTDELDSIIAADPVICCAPSHDKDRWGPGLEQAIGILGNRKGRHPIPHLLRRTRFTEKRTKPGSNRSKDLNRETIEVTHAVAIENRPVVVVDDVTTTGSTLEVCAELLWAAGCNCVGAIAIGRTTNPNNRSSRDINRPAIDDLGSDLDDEIPF